VQVHLLDLKTMAWSRLDTTTPPPKARYAHGVVALGSDIAVPGTPPGSTHVLMFGGHGGRSRWVPRAMT